MARSFVIRSATIVNPLYKQEKMYIVVRNGKVSDIGKDAQYEQPNEQKILPEVTADAQTMFVPGMIDVHIHGTSNADTMDATEEALSTIAGSLPSEGTTSFLATTLTQSEQAITDALVNAAAFKRSGQRDNQAEMVGVHLEGPFFTEEKAGAQPKEHLRQADTALFQKWQQAAEGLIKWVSLAPEQDPDHDLIRFLHETGVVAAAAHSNASSEEVEKAIDDGLSHVTHLFNGMSGLHHRTPGLAAAALIRPELTNEIIADGVHVHPTMVQLAYQLKGAFGLLLITDSIRAKCLQNGEYDLGGQTVTVRGNRPYLEDGTIAGSMLKMNEALKNSIAFTGCTEEEACAMASWNAACKLGVEDRKGNIAVGKDADIVQLDCDSKEVIRTWCKGTLAYEQ
ncbi:N-acetylglucosamine 6-phosphate deacetylase [Alteribacillus persepolensis]|uniref:N-acetylglucosamine-6-phosphate deacetylase n=1 Tax=Alteribacillus persepolensis TaxID=568899 RepID=A0A1G8B0J3_9BACI|nr:N-acetylglucosamine-6-phosphate deacetylase [Alteribacillus persepolensis]SDH26792.1 N-acetylglucosamine 6-phosphate deacetylase [Alteribacillus persepolensis]